VDQVKGQLRLQRSTESNNCLADLVRDLKLLNTPYVSPPITVTVVDSQVMLVAFDIYDEMADEEIQALTVTLEAFIPYLLTPCLLIKNDVPVRWLGTPEQAIRRQSTRALAEIQSRLALLTPADQETLARTLMDAIPVAMVPGSIVDVFHKMQAALAV
jgi:hypothetical protein